MNATTAMMDTDIIVMPKLTDKSSERIKYQQGCLRLQLNRPLSNKVRAVLKMQIHKLEAVYQQKVEEEKRLIAENDKMLEQEAATRLLVQAMFGMSEEDILEEDEMDKFDEWLDDLLVRE